nr:immunoglobulin light chain junction region [Macaca mulatta]
CMQATEVWTF